MPLLFSYGTLQDERVQVSTFGRALQGTRDGLPGFEPSLVPIDDPAVASASGQTHHANVTRAAGTRHRVEGMVFQVTDAELAAADAYERAASYVRELVTLASGTQAWVYRHSGSMSAARPAASAVPHPGVQYPPPILYVAGLAAGWLAHRAWPLSITADDSALRETAALVFIGLWAALFVSALVTFRASRTTMIPNRPAAVVVRSGPYRLTRNPMYVSLVALFVGVTLMANSWWPLLFLPIVVIAVDRLVIVREERYLASAFPTEYRAYAARVRRWI